MFPIHLLYFGSGSIKTNRGDLEPEKLFLPSAFIYLPRIRFRLRNYPGGHFGSERGTSSPLKSPDADLIVAGILPVTNDPSTASATKADDKCVSSCHGWVIRRVRHIFLPQSGLFELVPRKAARVPFD